MAIHIWRWKDSCRVDHSIEPAKSSHCSFECPSDTVPIHQVQFATGNSLPLAHPSYFSFCLGSRFPVLISDHDMSASFSQPHGGYSPNPAASSHDHKYSAAKLLFRRHSPEFCFFQPPVFNVESFPQRQGHIIVKTREMH